MLASSPNLATRDMTSHLASAFGFACDARMVLSGCAFGPLRLARAPTDAKTQEQAKEYAVRMPF